MEFALVSVLLIPLILFILCVALILYFNQELDYATVKAARQVMIGAVQTAGTSQSAFQTQVCSYLPAAFDCTKLIVNLQTATEAAQPGGYYSFVNSNQTSLIIPDLSGGSVSYSAGAHGDYEYLQVVYPITFMPSMFASLLGNATYQGSPAYLAVSTAAFRNEQY